MGALWRWRRDCSAVLGDRARATVVLVAKQRASALDNYGAIANVFPAPPFQLAESSIPDLRKA